MGFVYKGGHIWGGGATRLGCGHTWGKIFQRRGLKLWDEQKELVTDTCTVPSQHFIQKGKFTCFKRRAAMPKRVYKWVRRSGLHRTRITLAASARPWPRSASVSLCVIWRNTCYSIRARLCSALSAVPLTDATVHTAHSSLSPRWRNKCNTSRSNAFIVPCILCRL